MTMPSLAPLDVRLIPPTIRHATIFGLLESLTPGEVLNIINDHDPAPLRRQIEARYPDNYSWNYLLQGPDIWQVGIGRLDMATAADCGGHGEGNPCTCGH